MAKIHKKDYFEIMRELSTKLRNAVLLEDWNSIHSLVFEINKFHTNSEVIELLEEE